MRDREKLANLSAGGAKDRPIVVETAAVIEGRVRAMPCVQCEGEYRVGEHRSAGPGLRAVDAKCARCGAPRTVWFRIVVAEPN